jgi:hypothetical protein
VIYAAGLAHGIIASLAVAGFFYVAGLTLTPKRCDLHLRDAGFPVVGAAAYVLLSWIALTSHEIPLRLISQAFAVAIVALAAVRARRVWDAVRVRVASRQVWMWVLAYGLLFALIGVMALPPRPGLYLPTMGTGDVDLLTHARYARHLQFFGIAHLDQPSFDYLRSPAMSYLLAGFSLAYLREPLAAALPFQFALTALVGFASARFARSVFHLSNIAAFAVACVVITSPILQAVSSAYRLAVLLAIPILLYHLWVTLTVRPGRPVDFAAIVTFAGPWVLLLFSEPTVLVAALVLQGATIVALRKRRSPALIVSAAMPLVILLLAVPDRIRWSLSHLDRSDGATAGVITLAVIGLAAAGRFLSRSDVLDKVTHSPTDRRLALAFARYVAIAVVVGNVTVQAVNKPEVKRLPESSRRIAQLADLSIRELTLRVDDDADSVLPALTRYYLPQTKVHVAVRMRDLDFETISRKSPMLIESLGCESVGHKDALPIRGLGCLLFAPPSIEIGRAYLFNHSVLFLNSQDMTVRNPQGRLNRRGRTVPLRLLADPARTRIDRDLYVNLLLGTPQQVGDPRHVVFGWGAGRRGEAIIDGRHWVSMRVATGDWSGNRVWTLPVTVDVLNARSMLFAELSVTEQPLGALVE